MSSNLCSRGFYGCKHDEGHVPTRENVLQYFKDHDGYVISRRLSDHFGCCTRERTDELSSMLTHLEYTTKEISRLAGGTWGSVGSKNPKVMVQRRFQFKEMPAGKIHFVQDGVMLHDRTGGLRYDYATTEIKDEVTCGLCLNILKARARKAR